MPRKSAQGARIVTQGRRYWSNAGTSRGKISGITWGHPGDFAQCVTRVSRYLGPRAKGYCALRHKQATGAWPGHAPGERGGGKSRSGKSRR